MYWKPFLSKNGYVASAFDQQMGQIRSLRHKPRLQSHVVLTQFVIVPGLCGKDPFNFQIAEGVWANFSVLQLAPKLIISTFESGKDLTVSCSSIWSEEAGVNDFVFVTHFRPKKTRQFVPLPFVGPLGFNSPNIARPNLGSRRRTN